jgi:TPP-dependent 2-oxoacid decarboxylase
MTALLLLGVIFSDTNFALSHRRLDPRRTIVAFDRTVRIGYHVYPDLPIDDLIEALSDGAFQMTGWELGNCRRYGFDPIVVLFNNACRSLFKVVAIN